MSIEAISWVLKHSDERLGRRLVLLALADNAHDDGSNAWPSQATIAQKARLTDRQVRNCLREMEDKSIEKTGTHESGVTIWRIVMGAENTSTPESDYSVTGKIEQQGRKNLTEEVSDFSYKPLYKPSIEPSVKKDTILTDFEEFYSRFPLKVKKFKAEPAYRKARTRATHAEIMAGIPPYEASVKERRENGFRDLNWQAPEAWLNAGRWLDENPTASTPEDPRKREIEKARRSLTEIERAERRSNSTFPYDTDSRLLMGEPDLNGTSGETRGNNDSPSTSAAT